jgi:molybdopterin converting factor small subunit
MRITLKLFATLGEFLPAGATANAAEVDVPDGASAHAVLDQFKVPRERAHLVMVNGIYLDARARDGRALQAGDALAIWPPVAGG